VFLHDCVGEEVQKACADPTPGTVILLENLRFHAEEEGTGVDENGKEFKPSKEAIEKFRQQLTSLGGLFLFLCLYGWCLFIYLFVFVC
jgi:phosphoglycerate kinase